MNVYWKMKVVFSDDTNKEKFCFFAENMLQQCVSIDKMKVVT